MRKPYSLRLPQFDPLSGGIKVMWGLFGGLLLKGEEVVANAVYNDSSNVVGVYPEIFHGNELRSGTVVRYILNKPGVMASGGIPGPTEFPKTDLLFTFSKMFMDLPDERCMFLPIINTDVFFDRKGKRDREAVFVGKGVATSPHDGHVVITRELAADQELLAEILNRCSVLHTYDPVSAMSEIARLCGCRVNYLSREYTRNDYLKYEPGVNGMTFPDDKDVSMLNSVAFRDTYNALQARFYNVSLPNFIRITQQS